MFDKKAKPALTLAHSVETPEFHRELLSAACGSDNARFSALVDRVAARASLVLLEDGSPALNASVNEAESTSTESIPDA